MMRFCKFACSTKGSRWAWAENGAGHESRAGGSTWLASSLIGGGAQHEYLNFPENWQWVAEYSLKR